ncbi:hypothetical protein B566_EDAN015342, partial [Ephemera danica]
MHIYTAIFYTEFHLKQVKMEVEENASSVQQVNLIPREVKNEILSPQTANIQSSATGSSTEPNCYPDNPDRHKGSKSNEPLFLLDQNYAFRLHEISKAPEMKREDVDPFSCQECTKQFENNKQLHEHQESDEHLFYKAYQNFGPENSSNKKLPASLSGAYFGILVQTSENKEGCGSLQVNLLQEEHQKPVSKDIQLVVTYKPKKNSKLLIYLDRTFLLLGNPAAEIVEANAPRQVLPQGTQIKRNVKIQESKVGSIDYIVVFKF